MLELRPNCELCDRDLPPDSGDARICTYECTFCAHCVETRLYDVCPNCGGGFSARPLRPATAWRDGTGLGFHPASTRRVHTPYSDAEIKDFARRIKSIAPAQR